MGSPTWRCRSRCQPARDAATTLLDPKVARIADDSGAKLESEVPPGSSSPITRPRAGRRVLHFFYTAAWCLVVQRGTSVTSGFALVTATSSPLATVLNDRIGQLTKLDEACQRGIFRFTRAEGSDRAAGRLVRRSVDLIHVGTRFTKSSQAKFAPGTGVIGATAALDQGCHGHAQPPCSQRASGEVRSVAAVISVRPPWWRRVQWIGGSAAARC